MIGSGFERREPSEAPAAAAAPKRVYELAKELGLAHRDLVAKIRSLGIEVANHMSALAATDVERLRRAIDRERHETLEEQRLSETVIRRRSRTTVPAAPAVRPAAPPIAA